MRVCVISSTVFPVPLHNYGGLEAVACECARGLAARGHRVTLIAPLGSSCPGVEVLGCLPPGMGEEQAYGGCVWKDGSGKDYRWPGYWQKLLEFNDGGVVIDHSVAGDESLLARIAGKARWLTFEALFDWASQHGPAIIDGDSVEIRVNGLEVPSAINVHDIAWRPVSTVIRHQKKDPIHRVKTAGGLSVDVTSGHSVMVAGASGLEACQAKSSEGKSVAFAKRLPANEADLIFWPVPVDCISKQRICGDEVAQAVERNYDCLLAKASRTTSLKEAKRKVGTWKNNTIAAGTLPAAPDRFKIKLRRGREVEWPIKLTDDDLVLMGLWIGDGCYDGDTVVRLSSGCNAKYVADRVAAEFKAKCFDCRGRPDVSHQIHSALLATMMRAVGFVGDSYTKAVPDWMFDLSPRQIGLFLRGYFSADGHIGGDQTRGRLCVNSVNGKLIKQVSVLLSLCGIRHNICPVKAGIDSWSGKPSKPGWELGVVNDSYEDFLRLVGFVQGDRNKQLLCMIVAGRMSWRGDIPSCLVGVKSHSLSGSGLVSPTKVARLLGTSTADKFVQADIGWRKISSAQATDRTDKYVYDLSVPGTENFFAGLLCCHNSWQKWSYMLKAEGRLKAPVLGVMHAPVNTMIAQPPPVEKPCTVCISDDQRSHYEALFSPRKARTCHNGIDLDFYKPLDTPRTNRFLFLARFSSIKGADLAVKYCGELGLPLDAIGDVSITQEPEYYELCRGMARDKPGIKIMPGVPRGETVWWYSQAHCFLHPNLRFREPLGLAPLEAQACGLPVIAFNYGAMRETVCPGETGALVDNEVWFKEAVRNYAGPVSPQTRARCREWASQFSIQRNVCRYEELCTEALDTGGW